MAVKIDIERVTPLGGKREGLTRFRCSIPLVHEEHGKYTVYYSFRMPTPFPMPQGKELEDYVMQTLKDIAAQAHETLSGAQK